MLVLLFFFLIQLYALMILDVLGTMETIFSKKIQSGDMHRLDLV